MSCNNQNESCDNQNESCDNQNESCDKQIYPQIHVDNPCCEPTNRESKLIEGGTECGVTQAFDGPRKGIHNGKSHIDGTNRNQGIASLNYYDGCCSWKDIKYLQPLELENFFDPPKHEYDNYNKSRLRLKLLRDMYSYARKSVHDFIMSVQEMETRVQNDMSPTELQILELDYISNMNNMLKDFKSAVTRLDKYQTRDIHINTANYRHMIDVRFAETAPTTVKANTEDTSGWSGSSDTVRINNTDITVLVSGGLNKSKYPITRSNEIEVEWSAPERHELVTPLHYIPGFSFAINTITSQCLLSINEPRHCIGNDTQKGRRINQDWQYEYCIGPNIRAYSTTDGATTDDPLNITAGSNNPYSFANPDMARNLINDMTVYLYNSSHTTQNFDNTLGEQSVSELVMKNQYSNPRGVELHLDKLLQNILRSDRQLVQGDIVRKLPLVEAYATDYYGNKQDSDLDLNGSNY